MPLFHHIIIIIYNVLLFNTKQILCLVILNDFKLNDYYIGSSRIFEHYSKVKKRDVSISARPEFLFDLKLYNNGRPLNVYIKQRDSDIVADKTIFKKIFNISDIDYDFVPKISNLYEGFIIGNPNNSSVSGYIKDNNFYGHIIINNTVYYVDELKDSSNDHEERNAFIFKKDSVTMGLVLGNEKFAKESFGAVKKLDYYKSKFKRWKKKGMLCPMVIVIDHSFLTIVHKSNIEAAIFQVLFSLEEANAVFRSTDFDEDGVPDNIGIYVKKIVVITTSEPVYFLTDYRPGIVEVYDYLGKFIRYEELTRHCLGMVFTAQKFDLGTLGASYTPESTSSYPISGICNGNTFAFGSMNALVISASTTRTPLVNQLVFEVTITHELGHSFGSGHDSNQRCFGHVMSPKSLPYYTGNRTYVVFSPCSKELIIRTLAIKGDCFEEAHTSFCGNGIIEEGEDCDCGLTRDCLLKDPCCIPRRTKDYPCKINRKKGFQCHPSQGQCCTKGCRYSMNLEKFMGCKYFNNTCPCMNNATTCTCQLNGMCIEDQCHSIECTRIQLQECQCQMKSPNKICQVCCQFKNNCVSALEATNKVLSLAINQSAVLARINHKPLVIHEMKQFVFKKFCRNGSCVNLPFFQGKLDGYCFYQGKLGKCQLDSQCKIFKSMQIESASMKFTVNDLNMFCYLCLNCFLIYLFC